MNEDITISSSNYGQASNTVSGEAFVADTMALPQFALGGAHVAKGFNAAQGTGQFFTLQTSQEHTWMAQTQQDFMRLVRVMLIDPDERMPREQRVLFVADEKWTDLTDQELRDQLNIADILAKHNEARARIMFKVKGSKDGAEPLEPIRSRDLVLHVLNIVSIALKKA